MRGMALSVKWVGQDFDRRRVPTRGMEDVLLTDTLKAKLSKASFPGDYWQLYLHLMPIPCWHMWTRAMWTRAVFYCAVYLRCHRNCIRKHVCEGSSIASHMEQPTSGQRCSLNYAHRTVEQFALLILHIDCRNSLMGAAHCIRTGE